MPLDVFRMRRVLLTAAAACALAALPLGRALAIDKIPYTDYHNGLIQVQASIDGRPPVPMLVDTGAGIDVVSTPVGGLVNVTTKYVSLRLTGQRIDLPVGNVVSFTLGTAKLDAPYVGVWSGLDGTGIDGLIAATAFRSSVATIDFREHQLIFEDNVSFPERKRTAMRIPILLQDDFGFALGLFARFDFGNGKTGLCEIDTGSTGITIDKRFAAGLGVNLSDPSLKHTHDAVGDRVQAPIKSFGLVDAPQSALSQPKVEFADLIYDCNVGNDYWAGRVLSLDIPSHAIWLQLNP